ncbi:MAG: hypothetical protein KDA84_22885, partial [Planctomycetaceae bacterium]|nr:hypothetical protein [Planctomycetaceae bacterium]
KSDGPLWNYLRIETFGFAVFWRTPAEYPKFIGLSSGTVSTIELDPNANFKKPLQTITRIDEHDDGQTLGVPCVVTSRAISEATV